MSYQSYYTTKRPVLTDKAAYPTGSQVELIDLDYLGTATVKFAARNGQPEHWEQLKIDELTAVVSLPQTGLPQGSQKPCIGLALEVLGNIRGILKAYSDGIAEKVPGALPLDPIHLAAIAVVIDYAQGEQSKLPQRGVAEPKPDFIVRAKTDEKSRYIAPISDRAVEYLQEHREEIEKASDYNAEYIATGPYLRTTEKGVQLILAKLTEEGFKIIER